jgi:hypothetical protein
MKTKNIEDAYPLILKIKALTKEIDEISGIATRAVNKESKCTLEINEVLNATKEKKVGFDEDGSLTTGYGGDFNGYMSMFSQMAQVQEAYSTGRKLKFKGESTTLTSKLSQETILRILHVLVQEKTQERDRLSDKLATLVG